MLVLGPVRRVGGIGSGLGAIRQQAHFLLALDPGGPPIVPALFAIALAVRRDGFLAGVQGPVRGHVADVEEERLFAGDGFLEKGDGMVVEGIGHEKIVGEFPRLVVEVEIILHHGMPIADHALAVGSEESVESAFDREVAPLPLADHGGVVTAGLQQLGNEYAFRKILRLVPVIALVAGLLTVETGQQRCPGRTADGVVVKPGETQAARCQRVDVGSIDLATVASQVRIPHVVRHYEEHIRRLDVPPPPCRDKDGR